MSCFITLWGVIGGSGDRSRKGRSRLPYCVVGLAAVAALVAGCSSSDGGTALPPLTPSATAPGSTPSASPSHETKQQELAAAKAVVRRYYALHNAATSLSTVRALQAITEPRCNCRELVRSLKDAIDRQRHYVGKGHVTSIKPVADSERAAEALVSFDATAGGLVRSDGSYVYRTAAQHHVVQNLYLESIHGRWLIRHVSLVSNGR